MAAWTIQYWDGSNWVTLAGVVEKIPQELNGHEEATFRIANTVANRAIVASDRKVKILFDSTVQFKGVLSAPQYGLTTISCLCYNECYMKMNAKDFTNTYVNIPANTILTAICGAAGVVAGSCPTTAVSVRFRRTICWDAATFLAKAVNKDFWCDEDGSGNPRFNIGDLGSAKGAVTPISWPDRGIDRSKKRDKVVIRGVDSDGVEIEGTAGAGTNIAVFTEKKASDVSTLNNIAAQKLAELNKNSSGVKLPVVISVSYNLFPGDTITLNNLTLNLVGDFRIWKTTKYVTTADVEVDRAQDVTEKDLQALESFEDLGIYPVVEEQLPQLDEYYHKPTDDVGDITDIPVAAPPFIVTLGEIDTDVDFRVWLQVQITRVESASAYIISYRTGAEQWRHISVEQPASGNPEAIKIFDVLPGTTYEIHCCSISKLGVASAWSASQYPVTGTNGIAPQVPTGLTATPTIDGVILGWTAGIATDLSHYRVYYGTSNPPTLPYGSSARPFTFWKKLQTEGYVLYYFAVSAVDSAGNESAKCTAVSTTPLQVKPIDLTIEGRPWVANFKMWENPANFGYFRWAAKDGVSDIVVKFADGSTKTVTKSINFWTPFPVGLLYCFWSSSPNLEYNQDYATAVGEGKGLICVVDVRTDRTSTILAFDSYAPTIGAGCIAAKTILTEHIKSAQIVTDLLAAGAVTADILAANSVVSDKIFAGAVTTDKIDALAVTAAEIAADAIIASKIKAGEVHTAHILFDLLTSDPTLAAGKLWYRSDKDQIRFAAGTLLADVAIIPKFPLYDIQAPPENMVSNQCFEVDRDADGKPDFWSYAGGTGTWVLDTTDSQKGGAALKLTAPSADAIYVWTTFVTVVASKKYFLGARTKCQYANNGDVIIGIVWYDKNKTELTGQNSYISGTSSGTTTWKAWTGEVIAPTDAKYARVILANETPITGPSWILFDDVIFSEMRAAVPTAGLVCGKAGYSATGRALILDSWKEMEVNLSVPTGDANAHEILFCSISIEHYAAYNTYCGQGVHVAVKDVTDGIWYPSDNHLLCPFCYGQTWLSDPNDVEDFSNVTITIPKDIRGHTLEVYLYLKYKAAPTQYALIRRFTIWGHSPHSHR